MPVPGSQIPRLGLFHFLSFFRYDTLGPLLYLFLSSASHVLSATSRRVLLYLALPWSISPKSPSKSVWSLGSLNLDAPPQQSLSPSSYIGRILGNLQHEKRRKFVGSCNSGPLSENNSMRSVVHPNKAEVRPGREGKQVGTGWNLLMVALAAKYSPSLLAWSQASLAWDVMVEYLYTMVFGSVAASFCLGHLQMRRGTRDLHPLQFFFSKGPGVRGSAGLPHIHTVKPRIPMMAYWHPP
ncbi:hypothetical protein CPB84DRAFT_1751414 [Gymnopilus junonius]|uniref:Uncharacterized protein n=1 Tax=Gymnopilus junonius TaxID=109634 RepID=A0A9P5NCI2_GYMJU|nr:hypothetical protein CPB84DRAFT_1751414 [Gymnopilus junonius]